MKLAFTISTLSIALACLLPGVLGYPIDGRTTSDLERRSIEVREYVPSDVTGSLERRTFPNPFKSKPLTEEEEAERKTRAQWKAQTALRKAQDKHDSKMAKIEHGPDYHVTTTYKHGASGEAEYGHIAHHEAQKYWKSDPQLHKFAHAEVSSKLHDDGRVHTTARYHNGGPSFSGATVHMFSDAPKPKAERKKVLGIF